MRTSVKEHEYKPGDVVFVNRKGKIICCVVSHQWAMDLRRSYTAYKVLQDGTPSKNKRNVFYVREEDVIGRNDKRPKVFGCPECFIEGYSWLEAPCKVIVKDWHYRCKLCKADFVMDNGELCSVTPQEH